MNLGARSAWILVAILFLAAFLRFWGIDYGLPHQYLHDENVEVVRALQLGAGQYDWSFDRAQRGGYFYLLFVEYGVYFMVLWVTGKIQTVGDFALEYARNPGPFFLIGRVTTALFGVATVGLLFAFARRFAGPVASLAASFFLAVSYLHVMESHAVNLDVPLTFFTLLAFFFMTRMTEDGAWADYLLAGVCVALASLHKIYMLLLFLPFLGAHIWWCASKPRRRSPAGAFLDRKLLAAGVASLALYLAGNPGIVVNLDELWERVRIFYGAAEVPDALVINYAGAEISGFLFYFQSFFRSFGLGITLLGLGGICCAALSRDRRHWLFLGFFLVLFLLFASTSGMFSNRYLLPVYPLFALYAGICLAWILRALTKRRVLVALAAAVLSIQPLAKTMAENVRFTRKDTRTLALEWFEAHVPEGSRVLIHGLRTFPNICSVPLKPSLESVEASIDRHYPEGHGRGDLLRNFFRPHPDDTTYTLILNGEHLERLPFQAYLDRGIEYAVVCECEDDLYLSPHGRERFPEIAEIYLMLDDPEHATLIKRLERTPAKPGPEIRLYRVHHDAGRGTGTGEIPARPARPPG